MVATVTKHCSPGFRTNALRSTLLVHGQASSDEAVRAIQTCRKHGQTAAQSAWRAGAYLSLLHARLIKGRKCASPGSAARGRSSTEDQHAATSCFTSGLRGPGVVSWTG